ncbi:MAG: LysM peptidoglycan-binding domain-containing protein [Ilumatobacteraceae bacterium]
MDHDIDSFDDPRGAAAPGADAPLGIDDVETEFWSRVPERRFGRPSRRSATSATSAPRAARRPGSVGSRTHHDDTGPIAVPRPITESIPVVTEVLAGPVRQATRHVDPLIRRLGVAAIVTALAVPVALSMRSDDPAAIADTAVAAAAGTDPTGTPTSAPSPATTIEVAGGSTSPWAAIDVESLPPAVPVNPDPTAAPAAAAQTAPAASSKVLTTTATKSTSGATASATAERTRPTACGAKYTVRSGDAWLVIADRANVALRDLLAVNTATTSTPLYPGRTICLPAGATVPSAPSAAPVTTAPKPTTTAAPAPTASYSKAQVAKIIRDVWPDNLEDKAIAIATRESNLNPSVRNYCCYGLFQIYYNVHRSWLADIGITNASKLYDPKLNAFAAYVLYLRSGSFAPWGG